MKLEDLFPPCPQKDCKLSPGEPPGHKHIFDHQREVLESPEQNILTSGGYGGGKSVVCAVLGHLLNMGIPGNRGLVLRRTLPKLQETAQREFVNVVQRSGTQVKEFGRRGLYVQQLVYPNGSEVIFRPSKELGQFLGPEYGWVWIDEAIEEPKETFDKLIGRIRLPHARPLKFLLSTNPPPPNHWLTKMFGAEANVRYMETEVDGEIVTIGYRRVGSRTLDNPALPKSYIATLKQNLAPSEVKRVLEGKTTFSYEGKPVYGLVFQYDKHVRPVQPFKDSTGILRPIARGWDFGFHAPAIGWHQIAKCREGTTHWLILREYIGKDITTDDLARIVILTTQMRYPGVPVVDVGDAAGAQVDHRGPGPIMMLARPRQQGGYNLRFRFKKFPNVEPGIQLILKLLREPRCRCGLATITIDPECEVHIEALAGGYHYKQERHDRELSAKPVKDGYYDNPMDEMRYVGELVYRPHLIAAEIRPEKYVEPRERWKLPGVVDPWERPFTPNQR